MATYVGIDVGKHALDIAIEGEPQVRRLPNDPTGWMAIAGLRPSILSTSGLGNWPRNCRA